MSEYCEFSTQRRRALARCRSKKKQELGAKTQELDVYGTINATDGWWFSRAVMLQYVPCAPMLCTCSVEKYPSPPWRGKPFISTPLFHFLRIALWVTAVARFVSVKMTVPGMPEPSYRRIRTRESLIFVWTERSTSTRPFFLSSTSPHRLPCYHPVLENIPKSNLKKNL